MAIEVILVDGQIVSVSAFEKEGVTIAELGFAVDDETRENFSAVSLFTMLPGYDGPEMIVSLVVFNRDTREAMEYNNPSDIFARLGRDIWPHFCASASITAEKKLQDYPAEEFYIMSPDLPERSALWALFDAIAQRAEGMGYVMKPVSQYHGQRMFIGLSDKASAPDAGQ